MGIFNRNKNKNTIEERTSFNQGLLFGTIGGFVTTQSMKLSVVYRCVQVISDAVAQMPLEVFSIDNDGYLTKAIEHPLYDMLSFEPNDNMSRFTFYKMIVTYLLLKGNAYIEIQRDKNYNPIKLTLLNPEDVTVQIDLNKNVSYSYRDNLINRPINKANMIHILNHSEDGIIGKSTLDYATNSLEISNNTEQQVKGFFKGGANMAGLLSVQGNPTEEQKKSIQNSFSSAFNTVSGKPNGIAVIPSNMTYQSISINPRDAQMLESRQFNVVDICRFFGVSPVKAFDLSTSTFNNVETMQLAFLTDTITPLLEKIEIEFHRKLFLKSERYKYELKFDVQRILRADMSSRSDYYTKMFNLGAYSTNEIRKEIGMPAIELGNKYYITANVKDINEVINSETNAKRSKK